MAKTNVELRELVQKRILDKLSPGDFDLNRFSEEIRASIDETLTTVLAEEGIVLAKAEKSRLCDEIAAETMGYGPLQPLLENSDITDIMTIGHEKIFVVRKGIVKRADVVFESEAHLLRIIHRFLGPMGKRLDEHSPIADVRLRDATRVNVVVPPVAVDGPVLTIHKFSKYLLTMQDVINFGSATDKLMEFLCACVVAGVNVLISGGAGAGKTTLLNILAGFVPDGERIITIEDIAELNLAHEQMVRLESRPSDPEARGAITTHALVLNALRMRPDRIIVGDVRGVEALDIIRAMNMGYDGMIASTYSKNPRDTLARLEIMCCMADKELSPRSVREQVASALQLIVHMEQLIDGSRKITKVSEIQGIEGDSITLSDVFVFEPGKPERPARGPIKGRIVPTGVEPKVMDRVKDAGISLSPDTFGIQTDQ